MGLHLGVVCLVRNEAGRVLIARRSDFGTWNFPTGRLDYGETLAHAAERETREETSIECVVERPVGLYYQAGRGRMNVAFLARHIGGSLEPDVLESSECRWSAVDEVPPDIFGPYMLRDALRDGLHLHIHETPPHLLRQLEQQLEERRRRNAQMGRPEPEWAEFEISARADVGGRIYRLPNVGADAAPWQQMIDSVVAQGGPRVPLAWVGVDENVVAHRLEFVFNQAQAAT